MINWNFFFENSSTTEALYDFAYNNSTFIKWSKDSWPKECKSLIAVMKCKGYIKSIKLARSALKRRGY